MNAKPLMDMLSREVEARCAALRSEAEAEAERIRNEARAQAESKRETALAQAQGEAAEALKRVRDRAESSAQMVVATTLDQLTDDVLARVQANLASAASAPSFAHALPGLLDEVLPEAPEEAEVLAPPTYVDAVRAALDARGRSDMTVRGSTEVVDGVAVQDPARRVRISNTLRARFRQREAALRKQCLDQLRAEGYSA